MGCRLQQAGSSAPGQEGRGGPRVPGRRRASAGGSRIRREACVHSVREAPESRTMSGSVDGGMGGWDSKTDTSTSTSTGTSRRGS